MKNDKFKIQMKDRKHWRKVKKEIQWQFKSGVIGETIIQSITLKFPFIEISDYRERKSYHHFLVLFVGNKREDNSLIYHLSFDKEIEKS